MAVFFKKYAIHVLLCLALGMALLYFFSSAESEIAITLDAKVEYDDSFQLFYVSAQKESFSEEESIRVHVKGSKEDQKIQFAIPSGVVLKGMVRIDLGDKLPANVSSDVVTIKAIRFKNSWYERVIPAELITTYFHADALIDPGVSGAFVMQATPVGYAPKLTSLDTPEMISLLQDLDKPALTDTLRVDIMIATFWSTLAFTVFYFLPPAKKATRAVKTGFVIGFVVLLCGPICAQLFFSVPEGTNIEKRAKTKLPVFSMHKQFARDFEAYYNDNFAFRSWIIQAGSIVKYKLFNTSATSDKAMVGEEDFIFYNNPLDKVFNSYTHRDLFTAEELYAYVHVFEEHQAQCDSIGAVYIEGFWPNKQAIYPEYLPTVMRMQIVDTISRAQQIMNYIKSTNSPVRFIDVTNALMAAKKDCILYRKFDTHWNNYGGYIGYKNLFEQCYPEFHIKPVPLSDFNITWENCEGRDLLYMMGIGDDMEVVEKEPVFTLKDRPVPYTLTNSTEYAPRTLTSICETCPDSRKVLIFRDSYTMALVQFYSLHFKEIIYIWGDGYERDIVNRVKPDIVMHVPSERLL